MSIYLSGGGEAPLHEFVADAARSSARREADLPRIAAVTCGTGDLGEFGDAMSAALTAAGLCEPVVLAYGPTDEAALADLVDIDALYIGGGDPRAYLRALQPIVGEIRRRVAEGTPYYGVSGGALIASEKVLVAGSRIGGVPVAPVAIDDSDADLELASGIGLIDITVDVHAAQWGTLGRLIAATEAGLVDGGVAIDEDTALVVADGGLSVVGSGSIWQVVPSEHGVSVSSAAAAS